MGSNPTPSEKINFMLNIQYYLLECRSRFYYCLLSLLMVFCFVYFFVDDFFYLCIFPRLEDAAGVASPCHPLGVTLSWPAGSSNQVLENTFFICTNISELFQSSVHVSIFFAILLLCPLILYNIWVFIVPSLFYYERYKFTHNFCLLFIVYLLATILSIFIVFPSIWQFFMDFQRTIGNSPFFQLQNQPRIASYLSFLFHIEIVTHLLCEIPFLFYLLLKYNYLPLNKVIKNRRIIYLISLVFVSIISPPEIFTQGCGFAISIFVFEFLILLQILSSKLRQGRAEPRHPLGVERL